MRESLWLALLPAVGQRLFINRILRAEEVSARHLLISSVTTLAGGRDPLALVVRRHAREAILFRSPIPLC